MGRAIDLFVTYRFLKLLTTPFEKQDAYKLGIIDKDGNRKIGKPIPGIKVSKPDPLKTSSRTCNSRIKKLIHNSP